MMKRLILLLVLMIGVQTASATILSASGTDEMFKAWSGITCTPAVVLCKSLSVLDERGDQGGEKVETLLYSGETIPVIESWDGYAKIYYGDGTKTGWVRNEYLMMDPAWYICDDDTQVYAYADVMAPCVALLDKGTKLPILTQYDDGASIAGWVCVSLRGAAGWIRKTPEDTAAQTWFRPEQLESIVRAELTIENETRECVIIERLNKLSEMLTNVQDHGAEIAGCPFMAELMLELSDGQTVKLDLATDSCCIYRVDHRDYSYARNLRNGDEGGPDNRVLFDMFDMDFQNYL